MKKKLNNKGFSLVELIVVIAIMAILVALLAPQFTKYVNRSRYSTDIKNGQEIATVVQTLIADRKLTGDTEIKEKFATGGTNIFDVAVTEKLTTQAPVSKVDKTKSFFVKCTPDKGEVSVFVANDDAGAVDAQMVYPKVGANYEGKTE